MLYSKLVRHFVQWDLRSLEILGLFKAVPYLAVLGMMLQP